MLDQPYLNIDNFNYTIMDSDKLREKERYFEQQELHSDDEHHSPNESFLAIGRALADVEAMPPPRLPRSFGSFLGPTMKEQRREWEARKTAQTSSTKPSITHPLKRSLTEPNSDVTDHSPDSSFSSIASRKRRKTRDGEGESQRMPKRTSSMPSLDVQANIPDYRQHGAVPRELKNGKKAQPATNIKLVPEERQIFKGKVVYMYPNNDISMVRRTRIHKLIQVGAIWVNSWRDDITHIVFDNRDDTYSDLLRHLNKTDLPRHIIIVKFEPYVPQCIQFGTLMDPTAGRHRVKGAPQPDASKLGRAAANSSSVLIPSSAQSISSSTSATENHPLVEDSMISENSLTGSNANPEESNNLDEEVVKDSFIHEDVKAPAQTYNDALSTAIEETKAIAHLPIDEDQDDDSRPLNSGGEDSGSETEEDEPVPKPRRSARVASSNGAGSGNRKMPLDTFSCMNPAGRQSSQNPNARTIEILDQMGKYYDQMQDQWRPVAYRKAIATLRQQDQKITTSKQAVALPFIGKRLADKIEEIVLTDRLRRLDSTRNDPTDQVLRLFLGIYGVGLVQANKWIQAGHRTLNDLITSAKLTDSQKIGIDHYKDFATRIPRAEVEAHGEYIETALHKLDPAMQSTIMGSYRRGAKDSGDIDIIISKPNASIAELRTIAFETLVPSLTASGFLKCKLATSSRHDEGTKWHGVSCLPTSTTWRRLDLLLVPDYEMGAALLYFTGNDIFNRSIRLLASKKGMRLNQRGLYKDVVRGRNREKLNEGTLVEGRSERKIFEILGVPWREPAERIC
ncbi:unnamed protein product [Periconia digitata]|uniref:DNA-directed DNA polymerase n=1 Tax=Periconia digitata TaxID=1303443 RepID=A0A9W4XDC6_9PLEO|nr:unnamed protein product [Periconia digitata]